MAFHFKHDTNLPDAVDNDRWEFSVTTDRDQGRIRIYAYIRNCRQLQRQAEARSEE